MYVSQRGVPSFCVWGWRVRLDLGLGGLPLAELNPYLGGPKHILLGQPKKVIWGQKWYANYVRSWQNSQKKVKKKFTFELCALAQSPMLAVEVCGAGATDGPKTGELGSGHCTLTRKLLPLPTSAFPAQKRSVPCFFNIWMCWKYVFLVPISLFHCL